MTQKPKGDMIGICYTKWNSSKGLKIIIEHGFEKGTTSPSNQINQIHG